MIPPTHRSLLWRCLDHEGHEFFHLLSDSSRWRLAGTAVLSFEGMPCRLDYEIFCDAGWRTTFAHVKGWVGNESVRHEVSVNPSGRWQLDGVERLDLDGCVDVDLGFSPSTNTIPIRRLGLAVGESAPVSAAWLRFPGFALEKFDQVYTRLAESHYRYESGGGQFMRDLEVDADGLVLEYPDLWTVVRSIENPEPAG
jgi:uncharacterized protein